MTKAMTGDTLVSTLLPRDYSDRPVNILMRRADMPWRGTGQENAIAVASAGPMTPPPTLRPCPHDRQRAARSRHGSLFLHSSSAACSAPASRRTVFRIPWPALLSLRPRRPGSVRRNSHARFRSAQIVSGLRIHPKSRIDVEKASQPDRRVGGNVGAPADDIADTIARHTHGLRQGIRRQAEGLHVLSARISPGCVRKRGMTLSFNGYPGSRRDPGRPRSTRSKRANDH